MAERNYWVMCDDNCRFPAMTKEQILAAIAEATGNAVSGVDNAFITKIREMNASANLKFWVGTMAQFNALAEKDENTLYIFSDDDTAEVFEQSISQLREDIDTFYAATAKKFTAPLRNSVAQLTDGAGYYLIYSKITNSISVCHGVVYWDGFSTTHARGGVWGASTSYRLLITADGDIEVYATEDGVEEKSAFDIYVAKIGE